MPGKERRGQGQGTGGPGGQNRDRQGQGQGQGQSRDRQQRRPREREEERDQLDERVVHVARTSKVLKGGRRFAFRAVVVVSDNHGQVGSASARRARCRAVRKASERAGQHAPVPTAGTTIPHIVTGDFRRRVAAGVARHRRYRRRRRRAVLEAAGIRDILTKSQGSANMLNVVAATFKALGSLRPGEEAKRRNRPVEALTPYWLRGGKDGEQ